MGKTKVDKIKSIEEQIQDLQQKREKIINDLCMKIGRKVMKTWDVNDEETAFEVIEALKEEAINLINSDSPIEKESNESTGNTDSVVTN